MSIRRINMPPTSGNSKKFERIIRGVKDKELLMKISEDSDDQ